MTQPLDVSFFKPLKTAWGKACEEFCLVHPGTAVTKCICRSVSSGVDFLCKVSTIVNGFQEAGICPLDPGAIPAAKLSPSQPFSSSDSSEALLSTFKEKSELRSLEKLIKPETLVLYNKRLDEGYDLETDDLYCIWSKMKKLCIKDCTDSAKPSTQTSNPTPNPLSLPAQKQKVLPALDEILQYPKPPNSKKKGGKSTSDMPKHLSSEQVIQYLEEKKAQKLKEKEDKIKRKEERVRKREEREREKEQKGLNVKGRNRRLLWQKSTVEAEEEVRSGVGETVKNEEEED